MRAHDSTDVEGDPHAEGHVQGYRSARDQIAESIRDLRLGGEPCGKHKWSTEKLVHFSCGGCGRWWSIGDADTESALSCPWCGYFAHAEAK